MYIPTSGDYTFHVTIDDGVRLFIGPTDIADRTNVLDLKSDDSPALEEDVWGTNGFVKYKGTKTLTEGWAPIEVEFAEHSGNARILIEWENNLGGIALTQIPITNFRHSLGNGSFACVGIERNVDNASFISLGRQNDIKSTAQPVDVYEAGMSYYASTEHSELDIFREAVAVVGDEYRYYLSHETNSGDVYLPEERVTAALDLSASRGIIANLVRSSYDSHVAIADYAELMTDGDGRHYYVLADEGIGLAKQLTSQPRYGQQDFLLKPGQSIELSGIVMKVNDINQLTKCPVGSADAAVQFGASCMKRFSRTIDYSEARQRGDFSMTLREMLAETYSTNPGGAAGCDIDLTTTISN